MKYLFIFTIGPVQNFLAQARKIHDLYSGSRLLSYLIEIALKEINDTHEIIFPKYESFQDNNIDSKPNRIVAILNFENSEGIKKFANNLKKKILEEFKKLFTEITPKITFLENIEIVNQIESFLQIHWVALIYENENYMEVYKKAERDLGAIKNLLEFKALEQDGVKCSLCGERTAYIFNKNNKKPKTNKVITLDLDLVQDNEGLCSICTLKRFHFKTNNSFDSTSDIAILDTLNTLKRLSVTSKKYSDTRNYYLDDLPKELTHDKKQELLVIHEEAKKNGLKFTTYYAIINFDGDSIGKVLAGAYLKKNVKLEVFHKSFSQCLANFAKEVKAKTDNIYGRTIYAGGDDFMGFININYIFQALDFYKKTFEKEIISKLADDLTTSELSFSAGIVIAHYKEPLSQVIKQSRVMVEKAKTFIYSKDQTKLKASFSLAVLKNSGESLYSSFKLNNEIIESLEYLTFSFLKESLSDNFIGVLEMEFSNFFNIPEDMLILETERILKKSGNKNTNLSELLAKINNIFENSSNMQSSPFNFLYSLYICSFISRQMNKTTAKISEVEVINNNG